MTAVLPRGWTWSNTLRLSLLFTSAMSIGVAVEATEVVLLEALSTTSAVAREVIVARTAKVERHKHRMFVM